MHLRSRCLVAVVAILALCAAAHADLARAVEQAVQSTPLKSATIGVSIRDAESNAQLVSINAAAPLIPASNMKLLTTGAALHILGGDFSFKTKLLHDNDRLIILGDGDPAFGDPELLNIMTDASGCAGIDVDTFLTFWIGPIREAGITSVREVVVDDRRFDREFVHPTWPADQLNRRYCAQVAGFNFHLNILHFFPRATSGSRPDISRFTPHVAWLDISNSGTSNADGDNTVWIARVIGSNRMTLRGNVKQTYGVPVPVTVHDMPEFFARLFSDRLKRSGMNVGGWRVSSADDPASTGTTIGPIITTSISTALVRCNRDSNNLYAEALLKRCGAAATGQPGSWANGRAALERAIEQRLRDPTLAQSIIVADGSGLSRDNRVSPSALTAWLGTFHRDRRLGQTFIDSLAEPGSDGTLRTRFRSSDLKGSHVQAKSGYISGVTSLSGYVTSPDGHRMAFSVIVNDVPDGATHQHARRLQERIVTLIAAELAAAPAQLGSD